MNVVYVLMYENNPIGVYASLDEAKAQCVEYWNKADSEYLELWQSFLKQDTIEATIAALVEDGLKNSNLLLRIIETSFYE